MTNQATHLHRRRRRRMPLWRVIVYDVLTAALILGLYAVFKLLIPALQPTAVRPAATPAPVLETAAPQATEAPGPVPAAAETAAPEPTSVPEPTPDPARPGRSALPSISATSRC